MNNMPFVDRSLVPWPELPSLTRFCQYLSRTGWIEAEQDNPKIRVFGTEQFGPVAERGKKDRAPILILASNDSYSDAKARIRDAIELIAFFRKVDASEIIDETFRYEYDTILQRIELPGIRGVPLKIMSDFISQTQEMIALASYIEFLGTTPLALPPSKSQKRNTIKEEALQKCLFGHTFPGSFGITIEMPIVPREGLMKEVSRVVPTHDRLVIQRLASGFKDISKASKKSGAKTIVDNFEHGFNIDLCNTMKETMKTVSQLGESVVVDYSFKWSPLIEIDKGFSEKPIRIVPHKVIPVIESASKLMMARHNKNTTQIQGYVIAAKNDPTVDEKNTKKRRTITIKASAENIKEVIVTLNQEDYEKALKANATEKEITVTGILEQDGEQRHRLYNPSRFSILS